MAWHAAKPPSGQLNDNDGSREWSDSCHRNGSCRRRNERNSASCFLLRRHQQHQQQHRRHLQVGLSCLRWMRKRVLPVFRRTNRTTSRFLRSKEEERKCLDEHCVNNFMASVEHPSLQPRSPGADCCSTKSVRLKKKPRVPVLLQTVSYQP